MRGKVCCVLTAGLACGVGMGIGSWTGAVVVICISVSFVLGMIAMFDE